MNEVKALSSPEVSPEEIERRVEEYRQMGWNRQAPAHVVYHDKDQPCPWPGCGLRIAGIAFQLERMASDAILERLLDAWWRGPGLVGVCPRCGKSVLFGLRTKQMVQAPDSLEHAWLPEDWHKKAHLVLKRK